MIESIQISPSDRAKCKDCRESIAKGEPRGVFPIFHRERGMTEGYFCCKCTKTKLTQQVKDFNRMLDDFQKMEKDAVRVLVAKAL